MILTRILPYGNPRTVANRKIGKTAYPVTWDADSGILLRKRCHGVQVITFKIIEYRHLLMENNLT